ncbi:MAG: signal transduction protein [Pseudomonadota bacterium]
MPRFVSTLALALTVAALGPSQASANESANMLTQADANKDGSVTSSEAKANRAKMFAKMDRNGDGVVNTSDRPSLVGKSKFDKAYKRASATADANTDGQITRREWETALSARFSRLDLDRNGTLDASEIARANR